MNPQEAMERRAFLGVTGSVAVAAALGEPDEKDTAQPAGAVRKSRTPDSRTAVIYGDVYKTHDTGPSHPESPARCDAIMKAVAPLAQSGAILVAKPRKADPESIRLCHRADYMAQVERDVSEGRSTLTTGDTEIGARSLDAALHAAGGVMEAVDLVLGGRARNAFCVVRPPGHHASAARGMGFCVFNNVAVGARYAQRKHGIGKVLIADWDVHHGNGTQDIFYEDGSVFFFSTHQFPWYPGTGRSRETGAGAGEGTKMNCPFRAGAGRAEILGAFRDRLMPAADAFRPDLVMVSAGFDSRAGDPLGGFKLSDEDFAALTAVMMEMAARHAKGRLVSVLEGGYNLEGLAAAALRHVQALAHRSVGDGKPGV